MRLFRMRWARSVALIHSWRAGELLLVDNHTMLHSRAPFNGLRYMLRFRSTIRFTNPS